MGDVSASNDTSLKVDAPPSRGRDMPLTLRQMSILYWRNVILLLASVVVGGRTLLAIRKSWRHTQHNNVRRFANLMIGILLFIELIQSIGWLIGVSIASAVDGLGPWKAISAERADAMCYGASILGFWLDVLIFTWHSVIAFLIWKWVVRQQGMAFLTRCLWYLLPACMLVAAVITAVPIAQDELGYWPHSDCFVRRSWKARHEPTLGILLNRMIVLPLCWLLVVVLNCSTVYYLRKEFSQQYSPVHSIKRLQVQLVFITTVFAVMWTVQSIPLYLDQRTFALEFATKWVFGIGFVDALIYGWPTSLKYIFGPCCLPLIKRLSSRRFNVREHQLEMQRQHDGQGAIARLQGGVESGPSTADWETMMPSMFLTTLNASDNSRVRATFRPDPAAFTASTVPQPPPHGLTAYNIFVTTLDMNYRHLTSTGGSLAGGTTSSGSGGRGGAQVDYDSHSIFDHDPALARGIEAWIPAGKLYHLYIVAVQRCRILTRLRHSIQTHLGGSGEYVLTGLGEIGDALYGKTALLVFARTVDVESGAFRLLASNQVRPVILRDLRGGCKGMVGLAFRYYDTAMAVINAHLPAISLYPEGRALEERDKHVSSMLQSLRLGGDDERWDAHLQYHHVILCGNLNFRMRHEPHDMITRIQASSRACQAEFERFRLHTEQQGVSGTEWNWRGHAYRRLWSLPDHQRHPDTRKGMTAPVIWNVALKESRCSDELTGTLSSPAVFTEAWAWVQHTDVLSWRLQRGLIFSGFTEPSITSPPSFKWRVGAMPDDYTERTVLEAAYVTGPLCTEGSHSSSGSTTVVPKWAPSYTDRILTRSLSDMASHLIVRAYDLCDHGPLACNSDHRAVAQAVTVLVNTSYVLTQGADQRIQERKTASTRKLDSSITAQAMAAATTMRHLSKDGRGGGGASLPRPDPSSSMSSKPFPLLVTLTLREFSFELAELEEREESIYGTLHPQDPMPQMKRSKSQDSITSTQAVAMGFHEEGVDESQGALSSCEEGGKEEEEKNEKRECRGDVEAPPQSQSELPTTILSPQPPPLPLTFGSLGRTSSAWRRIPSAFQRWCSVSLSRGASQPTGRASSAESGALGFIDHILLCYPLPVEDPLLSLRRAQALGDFFGTVSSPPLGQSRSVSLMGTKGRRTETGEHQSANIDSSSSGGDAGATVGTRTLENIYQIPWTRGLEYQVNLPYLHRERPSSFSSSSIFPPSTSSPSMGAAVAAARADTSRVVEGTSLSSQDASSESKENDGGTAARVNVLTMGPPRPCQHALIKLIDKCGKELGQGVFHVELQEGSCTGAPSISGGSGGAYMLSERRRGTELVTRQRVELSVGGRYQGTVSFTLGVKARKRAEDGSSLQHTQGHGER